MNILLILLILSVVILILGFIGFCIAVSTADKLMIETENYLNNYEKDTKRIYEKDTKQIYEYYEDDDLF